MTAVEAPPTTRTWIGWRQLMSLTVWVLPTIASLTLPATVIFVGLCVIPAPEQGDLIARLAGFESEALATPGGELRVVAIIGGATLAVWVLVTLLLVQFRGLLPWLALFTAPIRWWHSVVARFATIPLAVSGTLIATLWFISTLITTASRDGWGSWLFLWMVGPLALAIAGLGTGLSSRWGANQYGSYLMAFGSIWMVVLLPVVWLWAIGGLVVALLPVAPLVLTAMSLFGDFGFAEVVAGIPLESPWAFLALQPYTAFWLLGLVLGGLYWLPATIAWLVSGDTASRDDVRVRTVLLDVMRIVYTFPIGPR